jgi:putative tRNA adenosine deaminase-associated protein
VAYFAVVLTRHDGGWDVNDVDLDQVDDLTDLADLMRDSAASEDAEGPFLLFLEQEDLWFAIVRVDGEEDPRVFVSDRSAVEHSAYAEMLLEAAGGVHADAVEPEIVLLSDEDAEDAEDDDEEAPKEDTGPVGDQDLLADLGTNGDALVELCTKEGMLPSEVLTYLAEQAGAADALESVR